MASLRAPSVLLFIDRDLLARELGFEPPLKRFVVRIESTGDYVSCESLIANGRLSAPFPGMVRIENAVLIDASSVAPQLRLSL